MKLTFRGNTAERFSNRLTNKDIWGIAKTFFHIAQREFKYSEETVQSLDFSEENIHDQLSSSCEQEGSNSIYKKNLEKRSNSLLLNSEGIRVIESENSTDRLSSMKKNIFSVEHWIFTNLFKIDLSHNFLTSNSMYYLGVILNNCTNLITLDLSFNHIGEKGGIILFKNLIRLKKNTK
jgi:hypothetical protein